MIATVTKHSMFLHIKYKQTFVHFFFIVITLKPESSHFVFSDIQKLLKRFNLGLYIYVLIPNHIFLNFKVDIDPYRYCILGVCYVPGKT